MRAAHKGSGGGESKKEVRGSDSGIGMGVGATRCSREGRAAATHRRCGGNAAATKRATRKRRSNAAAAFVPPLGARAERGATGAALGTLSTHMGHSHGARCV
jgi:hypothetical protein